MGSYVQRDNNMRPMGLAVLLELKRWVFEPAPPDVLKACEPLAQALSKATDGKARLELGLTNAPSDGLLRSIPIVFGDDEPLTLDIEGKQYRPVVGVWTSARGEVESRHESDVGKYGIKHVEVPPGTSILAEPASGKGRLVAIVVDGEGQLIVAPGQKSTGDEEEAYVRVMVAPPDGAPDLPFAERAGWGRPMSYGGAAVSGPQYYVWSAASENDTQRVMLRVTIEQEQEGGGARGGSSFGMP
jgi:hypothetical protein